MILKRAGPLSPDFPHDPLRRLLCAVVLQALRDATAARVSVEDRESARAFLASWEGRALAAELSGVEEGRVGDVLEQLAISN